MASIALRDAENKDNARKMERRESKNDEEDEGGHVKDKV
jgi:hypothetical protein